MKTLTADRLRELLDYCPESGTFTRRVTIGGQKVGSSPSHVADGYLRFQVDGVLYRGHRLAWLHFYGRAPDRSLDHIDGDRLNNRISNLRECDDAENAQNAPYSPRADNTSGFRGVSFQSQRGKWQARIMVNGKSRSCGLFDTPEKAHAAYLEAKRRHHPFQASRAKGAFRASAP